VVLKEKLKNIAHQPGIYQMMNESGVVIYVGKARDLRQRLSSYFRSPLDSVKTEKLMSLVVDFHVTYTDSENEALLLEANLIKDLKPRYNVLLRDDKSYPYLFLSTHQVFPRLDFHRGAKKQKGRYFGPYPNAGSVRENLSLIQKLFKLRQCDDVFFANRTRPCLQYQIQRCTAPCVAYVTPEEYQQQVQNAIFFLEGKSAIIVGNLQREMDVASKALHYEEAARIRDVLIRMRRLSTTQYITGDQGDVDVMGIAQKMGQIAVSILFIRGGRLIGHRAFFPNTPPDTTMSDALAEFIPQYYLSPLRGEKAVQRIVTSEKLVDREWIQSALQTQLESKIVITDRHGEKFKQWQTLSRKNAELALEQHLSEKNTIAVKLEALQKALKLPNPLQRIECFDISHTQGESPVASCVVFGERGALKKDYRRFNIENITPGDDYAAMRQVVLRRYTRIKKEEGVLPDLLMIDGGLGQLNQAVEALNEIQVSGVAILGVSKGASRKPGLETLHLFGKSEPSHLNPTDMALHLIQFIRDEAHRFAITAHRGKRQKNRLVSPLESIDGVGVKRRQEILRHFGGLQELKKAGIADIAKIPGISEALAKKIYAKLHERD
jgi:excinuclease ABC subunit C